MITAARPESAPTLHRRPKRDEVLSSSRERSSLRQRHASAWLPPRVTRVERETHDLLTACRKAGRKKGDAMYWYNEHYRHGRTTEKAPLRKSGGSPRRPEQSNSCGSFWVGEANALGIFLGVCLVAEERVRVCCAYRAIVE